MTTFMIQLNNTTIVLMISCALLACKKNSEQDDAMSKPSTRSTSQSSQTPHVGANGSSVARIAERAPRSFGYETLIQTLGTKLVPEVMKQLEVDELVVPEVGDVLCKGAQAYAISLQGDGGLIIHVADGYLIAFGYGFHSSPLGISDETEKPYLNDFNLESEGKAEVLNENFDTVQIPVKKYVSKSKTDLKAMAYTHGSNRTLTFFDPTKVDELKLLPSPSSAVDKGTIDEVKKMLRNRDK